MRRTGRGYKSKRGDRHSCWSCSLPRGKTGGDGYCFRSGVYAMTWCVVPPHRRGLHLRLRTGGVSMYLTLLVGDSSIPRKLPLREGSTLRTLIPAGYLP